eukprot:9005836-Pyramimonas_sp.AAC.1
MYVSFAVAQVVSFMRCLRLGFAPGFQSSRCFFCSVGPFPISSCSCVFSFGGALLPDAASSWLLLATGDSVPQHQFVTCSLRGVASPACARSGPPIASGAVAALAAHVPGGAFEAPLLAPPGAGCARGWPAWRSPWRASSPSRGTSPGGIEVGVFGNGADTTATLFVLSGANPTGRRCLPSTVGLLSGGLGSGWGAATVGSGGGRGGGGGGSSARSHFAAAAAAGARSCPPTCTGRPSPRQPVLDADRAHPRCRLQGVLGLGPCRLSLAFLAVLWTATSTARGAAPPAPVPRGTGARRRRQDPIGRGEF